MDILLDALNLKFDIIAISESKLKKDIAPVHDIELPNYEIIDTRTEASKGGTLLYISDRLVYKPRQDLNIYESKKIESTFIEVINETGKNIIVGCIYKHHNISIKEFTETISISLSKISKERKTCYLAGNFNINLLQLENNTDIENYFDTITDLNFTPLITSPTRITSNTKTLIDNILYNDFSSNIVSGNITVGISDHTPQFALVPRNMSKRTNHETRNRKRYTRKYENINLPKFNQDLDKINWDTTGLEDAHEYGNNFFNVFNQILDIHAPITEIKSSKSRTKRNTKPWITTEMLKLVKSKDKTYQQFIKEKDPTAKEEFNLKYKQQKMK